MDPLAIVVEHGILLESARGPLPNLAALVAGEEIKGSWWSHRSSHAIFDAINVVAASPDVVRLRLVNAKVTLVHRRLWPALVRIADRLPPEALAALEEEHTSSGAHRVRTRPFPDWLPDEVVAAAARLSEAEAFDALPACLRPLAVRSLRDPTNQ